MENKFIYVKIKNICSLKDTIVKMSLGYAVSAAIYTDTYYIHTHTHTHRQIDILLSSTTKCIMTQGKTGGNVSIELQGRKHEEWMNK